MDWSAHIDYVYNKLLKYVGISYKLQYKVPSKCLSNICYAFVYPHILYGIELYANTFYSYLDKLVKLNNKLLQILQGKIRRSNLLDLYENYNTLPLPQLHQFSVLVFVHKFVHHRDTLPDIFHNYFTLSSSVHNYATRPKDGLYLFNINTTHGQRSVRHKGCTLWNGLPTTLQRNMSVSRFKTLLCPRTHRAESLSDDARLASICLTFDVCLSVCRVHRA